MSNTTQHTELTNRERRERLAARLVNRAKIGPIRFDENFDDCWIRNLVAAIIDTRFSGRKYAAIVKVSVHTYRNHQDLIRERVTSDFRHSLIRTLSNNPILTKPANRLPA